MNIDGKVFEVLDQRDVLPHQRMGAMAILREYPNGILEIDAGNRGESVDLRADEDAWDYADDLRRHTFMLPRGRVVLTEMTMDVYRTQVVPTLDFEPPPFNDIEEVHAYHYPRLLVG